MFFGPLFLILHLGMQLCFVGDKGLFIIAFSRCGDAVREERQVQEKCI